LKTIQQHCVHHRLRSVKIMKVFGVASSRSVLGIRVIMGYLAVSCHLIELGPFRLAHPCGSHDCMRQFQRRLFGSDSTLNSLLNYRKHRVISSSPSLGTSGSQNRLAISFFTLTEFLPFSFDMLIPQSKEMSLYWSPEQIRIQSNK